MDVVIAAGVESMTRVPMGLASQLPAKNGFGHYKSPGIEKKYPNIMTALGGLGHTLPFLVPDSWANAFWIATGIAGIVVFFELWAIAYIRARYMSLRILTMAFSCTSICSANDDRLRN